MKTRIIEILYDDGGVRRDEQFKSLAAARKAMLNYKFCNPALYDNYYDEDGDLDESKSRVGFLNTKDKIYYI